MRLPAAQAGLLLAAGALLAFVLALAVIRNVRDRDSTSPQPEGNYVALAGSSGPAAFGRRTVCGGVIQPETEGVAHPTLPCGARIIIAFHGTRVLTQVIDRGPHAPGRQFDVTDALARKLGLRGVQQIHWSYARIG